jgi:hypothetical protein
MEKKIHDQLEESHAKKHLRAAAFESALFGTGIMKGPFAVDKEYANWDEDGNYSPSMQTGMKRVITLLSLKLFHRQLLFLFGIFIQIQMLPQWKRLNT